MKFGAKTKTEYNTVWKIRAYVKLDDGRKYYSNIASYSIINIATTLYNNSLMQNEFSHNYLYQNILLKDNPNYPKKDYKAGNGLVRP